MNSIPRLGGLLKDLGGATESHSQCGGSREKKGGGGREKKRLKSSPRLGGLLKNLGGANEPPPQCPPPPPPMRTCIPQGRLGATEQREALGKGRLVKEVMLGMGCGETQELGGQKGGSRGA